MSDAWVATAKKAFIAGKVKAGLQLGPAITQFKVKLLILSDQCQQNLQQDLNDKAKMYKIPLRVVSDDQLKQTNRVLANAMGITDEALAKQITEEIDNG